MYAIHRLWFDALENRDAFGFTLIGYVATTEEAERICSLESVAKAQYPWPLNFASYPGDTVPRFICNEVKDISGLSLEELKAL